MRKSLIPLGLIATLVLVPTAASAAPSDLRDPFSQLLGVEGDEGAGDLTTTDPTVEDPTVVDDPDPVPPGEDGLPSTGSDTRDWLAVAYLLIAVGAGLTAIARVARPQRRRTLF